MQDAGAQNLLDVLAAVLNAPGVAAEVNRRLEERLPLASEPFVDAQVIARVLGIPVKTVRQYAREGRWPCYYVGRNVRFRESQVEQAVLDGRLAS
jgi:excisionase family DNA binding protein